MSDLRVPSVPESARIVASVASDGGGQPQHREREPEEGQRRRPPPAPELAAALSEGGLAVEARWEQADDGSPRVRIVDRDSGDTVSLLTPEELHALASSAALPPGLLLQAST